MEGLRAADLLQLPVRVNGIQLGTPVDALVDATDDRLLGLELLCGDGSLRFLPYAVATVTPVEIQVSSALALVDEPGLGFYRRQSRRLLELDLPDPWIDETGRVHPARSAA